MFHLQYCWHLFKASVEASVANVVNADKMRCCYKTRRPLGISFKAIYHIGLLRWHQSWLSSSDFMPESVHSLHPSLITVYVHNQCFSGWFYPVQQKLRCFAFQHFVWNLILKLCTAIHNMHTHVHIQAERRRIQIHQSHTPLVNQVLCNHSSVIMMQCEVCMFVSVE